jgi:methionyl-tRNA formyltransferase
MSERLRVGFAGTPKFAATILDAMLAGGYVPAVVYTQPDRRSGRGRRTHPSPVKALAVTHDIPVVQPQTLRNDEALGVLSDFQLDILVVAAYGLILPATALAAPRLGCINVHASLLPRWRGASPIQSAIAAGDSTSGITIMQMDKGLDTGGIISVEPCSITPNDTAETLENKLATLGANALVKVLKRAAIEPFASTAQPDVGASYAGRISKSDGALAVEGDATVAARLVRAYQPWPVAYLDLADERLRVHGALSIEADSTVHTRPGTVVNVNQEGIDIAFGNGILRLTQLQRPGGKVITAAQYHQARPTRRGDLASTSL